MEQVLMDKMLTWLDYQAGSSQPFFLYYAPNAIHRSVYSKWLVRAAAGRTEQHAEQRCM